MKCSGRLLSLILCLILLCGLTLPAAAAPGDTSQTTKPVYSAGNNVVSNNDAKIDLSFANGGYVVCTYIGKTDKRIKVKIEKASGPNSGTAYTYDLSNSGKSETFGFQLGDGNYTVKVLRNTEGNKYATVLSTEVTVKLIDQFAPFLIPVQNINYGANSEVVKKAAALCKGKTSDRDKVEAVWTEIVNTIVYDKNKASQVNGGSLTGYIPNVDTVLTSKKGICYDYSSLLAAMLRSQGIPCKLVMGYVNYNGGKLYHAWNEVYIKGEGWIKVKSSVYFDGKNFSLMDSTFAAGNNDGSLTSFLGDGKNYANVAYFY